MTRCDVRRLCCGWFLVALSAIDAPFCSAQTGDAAARKKAGFEWVNPLPRSRDVAVRHATFESRANETRVGYCIYLPPGYERPENADRRYPVVYWLHGGRPGSELKALNVIPYIDRAIRQGDVQPKIYVLPNGGKLSHYDHEQSLGESAFLELIAHVDQTYRTIANRKGRAVEGFSQGGRGTGRYMLKHPELFCSAAPMGGGHQHEQRISENDGVESEAVTIKPAHNNTWDLARRFRPDPEQPLRVLVAVGDQDFNYEANQQWHQHLNQCGIDHEFIVVPGAPHSAKAVYEKIGLRVMRFHDKSFADAR